MKQDIKLVDHERGCINRYAAVLAANGSWSACRTLKEAQGVCRAAKDYGSESHIELVSLKVNNRVREFGIERFEKMISEWMSDQICIVGTRAEIIATGFVGEYVLDAFDKFHWDHREMFLWRDEYGNAITINRWGDDRYDVGVTCWHEPFPRLAHMPGPERFEDVDIAPMIARIRAQS